MPSPNVDQVLAQAQTLLHAAQPDAAVFHLNQLLQRKLSPEYQAHAHALLAQAYEFQSRWDEAAQLLRPYENRAHSAELPASVHQLVALRLASLHTEQGELPHAIHFARQALQLAKFADNPHIQGEAHQALGKIYRLLGQPVFARQHYQAALNLHQTLGARVLMAWSYYGLAIVAAGNGDYALAQQSLERAFNLVSEADDPLLYGLLCSVQATTLSLEEVAPLQERITWFTRAQAAFEKIGHQRFVARTLGNIGHQLLWDGQWQKAQAALQQALTLGQELQDRRSVASVLETLADLHALQGQEEKSQSYLAEALALVEDHDRFVELQVRLTLARLQWQQGQVTQARTEFEQVLVFAEEAESKHWQVVAQLHLVEIGIAERHWESVAERLPRCQAIVESLNNLGLVRHLRFVEGSLALAQHDLATAQEALGQARSMFAVSGRCWWLARTHFQWAEALAQANQIKAAHDAMRQAEQIFQTLAAQPYLQRIPAWFRQYPLPTKKTITKTSSPLTLPLPEIDGVGRLLRAAPFREVVLHELFVLLQAELPQCHLTISEQTATGAHRLLFQSNTSIPKPPPGLLRLEPWRCLPLLIKVRPAPTLTAKLGTLLQAAQNSLALCAARERDTFTTASEQQSVHLDRPLPGLVYQSQAMRQLAADIHNIQGSDITVLLLGETGTGKELIAQAIHTLSDRRDRPFRPFNCATLSLERTESQLFGHKKGAFTGASQAEPGVIRAAERGTLFLDEIGDLPLDVQPKLLRFLQSKEIHPLGASQPLRVNVRLIAATHHSLEDLVEQGKFREDLHYRLNVLSLVVPPLRDRREDVPLLVQHFLTRYSTETKKPGLRISPTALDDLMVYPWPGNVRELENVIQRLVTLLPMGATIQPADLAPRLRPAVVHTNGRMNRNVSLTDRVAEFEQAAIREALAKAGGNITQAALLLKLTRKGLQLKLKRYHIEAAEL